MDLQLKNVNVAPGDTLEGTASLTLNKDVEGKEVVAILSAEKTVTEREANGRVTRRQLPLYSKSETLDNEKLYTTANSPYQYKFAFVIPETGRSATQGTSLSVGIAPNLFANLFSGGGGIVRWYVKVELKHEAALKFPIAKTQEINIVAKKISQIVETSPQTSAPFSGSTTKSCVCGYQNPIEARFCSQCGKPLT